jgi:DNA topoisomerase-1
MKTLVIVESPSKADKIQSYLGKDYIVLASKGHIADLAKGGPHGLGVDVDHGFKPKYVLMDDKISILDSLIKAAKEVDQIFVASDPDREGEAIAWHLAKRLEDAGKPIKRMVFNEIKKDKLIKAVKNVRDIDMNLFHSQEARRILDRLVGFTASPFLINFLGTNLSAGRVQSVVTKMVIDREDEIQTFIPEDFWTIQLDLSLDKKNSFTAKYSDKLTDEITAKAVTATLSQKTSEYIVDEVIENEEKKIPPPPLVTSTLQQIMSKKYSFGAERTMKAAQALYESGYCTYIRTDSVRIGEDSLKEVREYLSNNNFEVPKKHNVFKNKDAAQDAHECIRPSDINLLPGQNFAIIDPDEKLVYDTIWKYFVASQMMPAVFNTIKVTFYHKQDPNLKIKSSGRALKYKGFLEILGFNDDSKIDIPNLSSGDTLYLFGKSPVKLEQKQTQPAPRYSEDKLIKELVNKNIGRPATYADLLGKITSRNYVEKKGNVYHATPLGKKITGMLSKFFTFMDYDYTAKMENQLDEIESGKINHVEMLKNFYTKYKKELDSAYIDNGGTLCEKCSSPMAYRVAKNTGNKFLACSSYPKCKHTISV